MCPYFAGFAFDIGRQHHAPQAAICSRFSRRLTRDKIAADDDRPS